MTPQVRDLQSLIKTQQAALKPQYDIIDQSIQQNDQSGAAAEAGLAAKQSAAFKGINQEAQNKGMFFSGFTPAEEASYTAGTYLPALADLRNTIAQTRLSLLGKKADLGKSAFDTATTQHESDLKTLNDWNQLTKQEQFQADQATKDRVFKAQQAEKDRAFQAQQNAQDRAAAAAKDKGAPAGLVDSIYSLMEKKKGKDKFVAPETFRAGMKQWVSAGGSPSSFVDTFGAYVNPVHQQKFGGYY